MHVEVKELSGAVRRVLEGVGYGARDIEIVAADSVELRTTANDGARGFVRVLNLDTGESRGAMGDFGGSGLGRRMSDYTDESFPIPENGAVIKGSVGYPRTFARIYAHPHAVGAYMLPSGEPADELSAEDQQALYCFGSIKGGEYRRDEMRRRNVSEATVDSLVSRGYLKRNRAGATQITTQGKNARTIRY
jgi:hypothetical protein